MKKFQYKTLLRERKTMGPWKGRILLQKRQQEHHYALAHLLKEFRRYLVYLTKGKKGGRTAK